MPVFESGTRHTLTPLRSAVPPVELWSAPTRYFFTPSEVLDSELLTSEEKFGALAAWEAEERLRWATSPASHQPQVLAQILECERALRQRMSVT